ncbi:YihY/virulence factor BrkB family protein [uncultured Ruminococcus sp.]|uniref:YihY/virulence factor BrkB family protein n=1 Tax=uncultured Ruminococcus sp. TaxID=165186 RepID=UPI00292CE135|nr:YihY/virulence factor BrkB family protein [uncultured Ruminococcus sp.]
MAEKKGILARVTNEIMWFLDVAYKDNIPALAGQSAFFMILSAPPLLMFAFTVLSMLTGQDIQSIGMSFLDRFRQIGDFPLLEYAERFIKTSVSRSGSGTAILTAIVTLWSAGNGMYCITEGISRVYKLPNKRIWLTKRLFSMLYTLLLLVVMMLDFAFMAINIVFATGIVTILGIKEARNIFLVIFYIAFGLLQAWLMALVIKLFLRDKVKDKRYISFRALMPGMLLTVICWYLLTFGVMAYIKNFATQSIYGSLGTVFVMMIWAYFLMYILLCCIEFNYIHREKFSGKKKADKKKLSSDDNKTSATADTNTKE